MPSMTTTVRKVSIVVLLLMAVMVATCTGAILMAKGEVSKLGRCAGRGEVACKRNRAKVALRRRILPMREDC